MVREQIQFYSKMPEQNDKNQKGIDTKNKIPKRVKFYPKSKFYIPKFQKFKILSPIFENRLDVPEYLQNQNHFQSSRKQFLDKRVNSIKINNINDKTDLKKKKQK